MRRSSEHPRVEPDLDAVNPWVCGGCAALADGRDPLPRGWITLKEQGGDVPVQHACGWECAEIVAGDMHQAGG